MAKYKVLSTKKLDPSLVEQAKRNDIEIVEQEFISVQPIRDLENFRQVLIHLKRPYAAFTSANTVTCLEYYLHPNVEDDLSYMPEWKIFCLEGKTKQAVLNVKHLKENIIAQAKNAADLAKKIIDQDVKEIVFFCGNKRREELPSILKQTGIEVHEVIVYETVETPSISKDVFDAVLFFSPSAVQSFFSINQLKNSVVCFAIGQTTADAISDFADNQTIVSEQPSQKMMLASLQSYFKKGNCYE